MFDEGVKQECTFLLVQNQSSWKNNGRAEKERGGKRGGGNDIHLESMPLNESLSKPKLSYGMVNLDE